MVWTEAVKGLIPGSSMKGLGYGFVKQYGVGLLRGQSTVSGGGGAGTWTPDY